MNHHHSDPEHQGSSPSFWGRPAGKAWITVALVAGFYLLREHWGHLLGLWPYLLLAACPLMHLMHGHGGHGHGRHGAPRPGASQEDQEGK